MAKRPLAVPLTALSTIITIGLGPLCTPAPTYASGVLDNGLQYWTIQDVIDYGVEAEAARTALCGTDIACKEQYYYDHMDDGEDRTRYQILDRFNTVRAWLTSINPTTGEAKFLYQGINGWDIAMGYEVEPDSLNELYFAWLQGDALNSYYDNSWFDPSRDHYVPYYVDEIRSGEPSSNVHEIFSYDVEYDSVVMYPSRTEISFNVSDNADLTNNNSGAVYYSVQVGGIRNYGEHNYSECINSPYYREGMECRFVFTDDYAERFIPFTTEGVPATAENSTILVDGTTDDNNDDNLNNNDDGNNNNDNDYNSSITNNTVVDATVPAPTSMPSTTTKPLITTPNTGQATDGEEKSGAFELPWWLTIIAILNISVIVWLFWPDPEIKKYSKSAKKVLKKS